MVTALNVPRHCLHTQVIIFGRTRITLIKYWEAVISREQQVELCVGLDSTKLLKVYDIRRKNMGKKITDLTGQKFNKLKVISYVGEKGKYMWLCECDCGNITKVSRNHLKNGHTKSCGDCPFITYFKHEDGYMIGVSTNGLKFYFDEKFFNKIKYFNWRISVRNYVYAIINKKYVQFHRFILNIQDVKIFVDHKDHNTLDNRISNLRICNRQKNRMNSIAVVNHTSKYKGVSWKKDNSKWISQIGYNKKKIYIGLFDSELEAAEAYNEKAKELFGEFAWLNKIEEVV
jgi:hypothetical protein